MLSLYLYHIPFRIKCKYCIVCITHKQYIVNKKIKKVLFYKHFVYQIIITQIIDLYSLLLNPNMITLKQFLKRRL